MKESQIQRAILDYLAAERIPAWRMNTGAMSGSHKGKKWFVRFGEKGMADILAAPQIRATDRRVILWIEVKAERGKLTADQGEFKKYVEDSGMDYIVARSVDEVSDWVRSWYR